MTEEQLAEGVPDRTMLILFAYKKEPDISGKSQAKKSGKKSGKSSKVRQKVR